MANLIRCVEGHIFDSDKRQCPVCGWVIPTAPATADGEITASTGLPGAGATAHRETPGGSGNARNVVFAAAGAISAAVVGIAIFFLVVKPKPAPPPPTPAIAKGDPAKPPSNNSKGTADGTSKSDPSQHEHHSASNDTPNAPSQTPDKPAPNNNTPQQLAKVDPAANANPVAPAAPPPAAPKQTSKNLANELTDWGIPQQLVLQRNVGSYTPTTLPGARRITTDELRQLGDKALLIDVLDEGNNHTTIPRAVHIPGAGNFGGGRFDDRLQRNFGNVLAQLTNRNLDQTLVFFCEGAQCWESYNAALRAINMGYRQVLWYRGGLNSWKAASLPLVAPAGIYSVN